MAQKLEPFDLEAAKRGDKLAYELYGTVFYISKRIEFVADTDSSVMIVWWVYKDGSSSVGLLPTTYILKQIENYNELRMAPKPPERKEAWVNIYKLDSYFNNTNSFCIHQSEEYAEVLKSSAREGKSVKVVFEKQEDGNWKIVGE